MTITFKLLHQHHFPLLLKWLEKPHVKLWWDQDIQWTSDLISQKYGEYLTGFKSDDGQLKPIKAFIIYFDNIPIGYAQLYNAYDFARSAPLTGLPEKLAAFDIYIGEPKFLHKGLGSIIIDQFLNEYACSFSHIFADPDSTNIAAIRAYEKAGFVKVTSQPITGEIWMIREQLNNTMLETLNNLSNQLNKLYGFVTIPGDNFGEPAINSGPCGAFAYAFYKIWNQRFSAKVHIVFIMMKDSEECWHVLVRLPNGSLFDGGHGVHSEDKYTENFIIEDMEDFDLAHLEKNSYGLDREYPRYCPNFSINAVEILIGQHLDALA